MLKVYTVFDVVAHNYKNLFLANTDGEAIRGILPQLGFFSLTINSSQLFHIADFDDEKGLIYALDDNRLVAWNSFDFEQLMPDVQLQAVKNQGIVPSDEKFVNAKVVGDALKAIGSKLGLNADNH